MVPSFKNTALIFPEIPFIQYFPLFSYKQYDVITDLICINIRTPLVVTQQRLDYLQNEKKTFLVCDKFDEIGHFRVPLCLCFKASLIAKPFL